MRLVYKPQVIKQLKKLSLSDKTKVINKLGVLTNDPYSGKLLKGEFEGLRSLRAWPYRIIYQVRKYQIVIYSITHRQSTYKK